MHLNGCLLPVTLRAALFEAVSALLCIYTDPSNETAKTDNVCVYSVTYPKVACAGAQLVARGLQIALDTIVKKGCGIFMNQSTFIAACFCDTDYCNNDTYVQSRFPITTGYTESDLESRIPELKWKAWPVESDKKVLFDCLLCYANNRTENCRSTETDERSRTPFVVVIIGIIVIAVTAPVAYKARASYRTKEAPEKSENTSSESQVSAKASATSESKSSFTSVSGSKIAPTSTKPGKDDQKSLIKPDNTQQSTIKSTTGATTKEEATKI
ncbi:hypothetical protein Q1695_001904 [Nippostrongylus brasiliensis]|nr:hypothetical protein Q1695_001904 [Nippostrongylus brasiliensis]